MGKSVTAALMGVLIQQGVYDLWQPAPVPEWQFSDDPRAKIRIADLLRMSSGLRIRAPYDPDYDPTGPYPDHLYLYTGGVNSFHYAATRPLQWPPNSVGRYRNTDPVLVNYLIRLAVERRGENYGSFPQHALFDKIGVRSMVIETDPFGNLLTQGYDLACARDWGTDPAARIRQVREYSGAGVGCRRQADLWRFLLDQWRRRSSRAQGHVLHGGRRRPIHHDHPFARSGCRTARAFQG